MSDETAIEDGGEETTPERPEWLPENFKSPEDLAASYKEAERKIHELAAKAKEAEQLAEQNREWQEWAQRQEQQQRQPAGDPRQQFMDVWDDPDRQPELVLHMAQQLAELQQQVSQGAQRGPDPVLTEVTAELAMNKAREQHPDWDLYHDQIAEIVQQSPHILGNAETLTPAQFAQGLDLAYSIAKGRSLATTGQAVNDAAEAARLAREQAQTMSGQSARPATQSENEAYWDRVKAADSGGYGS